LLSQVKFWLACSLNETFLFLVARFYTGSIMFGVECLVVVWFWVALFLFYVACLVASSVHVLSGMFHNWVVP